MYREDTGELWNKYESIFDSTEKKAMAFDKIARNYYQGNFGSMSKSDLDVLMFSIYLEMILEKFEDDINKYSDYTLAKQLGVTQSRVSTLKVKKQLQYPYNKFDWKQSFLRFCGNARYENDKIKINLRDKNLYYELKNQIDEHGGFVDTTLTPNLLVVSPSDFYDLVRSLMTVDEEKALTDAIMLKYRDNVDFCSAFQRLPTGAVLGRHFKAGIVDMFSEIVKDIAPFPANYGVTLLKTVCEAILN